MSNLSVPEHCAFGKIQGEGRMAWKGANLNCAVKPTVSSFIFLAGIMFGKGNEWKHLPLSQLLQQNAMIYATNGK